MRMLIALAAALLMPSAALASEFGSHPEAAIPDDTARVAPDPYTDFFKEVQQRLHDEGFDVGPVNGAWNTKTQAALAQFQLARNLPASGSLDKETLAALGVQDTI